MALIEDTNPFKPATLLCLAGGGDSISRPAASATGSELSRTTNPAISPHTVHMRLPSPPVFSPSPFRPSFPYFVSRGIFRRFHRAISVFRRWDRIPEHLHRPIVESRRLNGQPEDKSERERERLGDRIEIETKRKAVRGSRSIWGRGEGSKHEATRKRSNEEEARHEFCVQQVFVLFRRREWIFHRR